MASYDNAFDAEEIAAGIAEWAAIESPSFDPAAVNRMMDLAQDTMTRLGAAVERVPGTAGYGDAVRARFTWGEGPGILVLGHLDTVHLVGTLAETLAVRRDGDRLYGPGVLDMKGGMYLAVHAIEKIIEARDRLSLPVTFLFIPDEEIGSPSTRALIEAEARAHRYVLVPEPGKPDKFVTGRHAFLRYKLHTHGKPAHAGVAKGVGRSAISVMAQLIGQIEGFSNVEREVTYRVGNVQGGNFVNVIPTECHAEVLCVAPTPEDFEVVQARMASLVSPDPEVRLVVEPGPIRPLFTMHEATRDLFEVAQRVAREVGLDLGQGQFGGGSDGNFTGALGVPTLDGLGVCGDGVHTKQEHLLVSSLVPRARLLAGLFEALSERNR
ncbi:MAG: M20/M25/M40 family metallo-hydrolase [Rhodospirillaceae bacterium]|nr:M20/M25/M40 family metallo-hydrolase [Rhodospirillaceae bacterium]